MKFTSKNEAPQRSGWSAGDWSIEQKLATLAAFLPVLSAPTFQVGEGSGAEQQDDVIFMGSEELAPDALRFVQTAYDYGWVTDFAISGPSCGFRNGQLCESGVNDIAVIETGIHTTAPRHAWLARNFSRRQRGADRGIIERGKRRRRLPAHG